MKTKYIKPGLHVVNVTPQTILTMSGANNMEFKLYWNQVSDEDEY